MSPCRCSRSERGAVIPLVALLLPVLLVMTAMAVDLGRQRVSRRDMQAAADVVALDLSRLASGRPLHQVLAGSGDFPPAATALARSAQRNEVDPAQLEVTWGVWDPAATPRFRPLDPVAHTDAAPNAVQVVATETTDYYFQPGEGTVSRDAAAFYGAEPVAGFSVGSYAARVAPPRDSLINQVVQPLVGSEAFLDVLSHQGLAEAQVSLQALRRSLHADLQALTTRELLEADIALEDLLTAAATVLGADESTAASAAVLQAALDAGVEDLGISLGDLVHAEQGHEEQAMAATVDVPTLVRTAAFLSRCQPSPEGLDGADCAALDLDGTTVTVPGADVSVAELKVVESPRSHFGPVGTGIDTAQVRLVLDATVAPQLVGTCTPDSFGLTCLLADLLSPVARVDAAVTARIELDLVGGDNVISSIGCADPTGEHLTIRSTTRLLSDATDLDIGITFDGYGPFGSHVGTLGDLELHPVDAPPSDEVTFFVPPEVLGQVTKSTGDPSLDGILGAHLTANDQTVLSSLAQLGIDLTFEAALERLLDPLLGGVEAAVIEPLLSHLGVNLLGSDLTARAIDCHGARVQLVQ